jgi:hypothetical protein
VRFAVGLRLTRSISDWRSFGSIARRVDQLAGDAHPVAGFAPAASCALLRSPPLFIDFDASDTLVSLTSRIKSEHVTGPRKGGYSARIEPEL